MIDLAHLDSEVRPVMNLTTDERIRFAQKDHWIGYGRAQEAIQSLSDLLEHPKTIRMPGLLIAGESGNGKSTIIERFRDRHPVVVQPNGSALVPVVVVQMPAEPSESRFWTEVLNSLMIAHRDSDSIEKKKLQAQSVLIRVGCRMLVVEEIHNLLNGHARAQRQFLAALKNMSNQLQIALVVVGTRDAVRALHTDDQLAKRFRPFGLPKWKLDTDFLRLLASCERLMPLGNPSGLASRSLAPKIFDMTDCTIGGVIELIKVATVAAIRTKAEAIDMPILESLAWITKKKYGDQADLL